MDTERVNVEALKKIACDAIDCQSKQLQQLSLAIWNHPELYYKEVKAHKALTDYLESTGFEVEHSYKLATAFRGCHGTSSSGPHVALLSEYDALPDIGHACGHNLIAITGVAAGVGVKAAMEQAGTPIGKLTVLGTPAEEAGGGKIDLINQEVFCDIDAALMAHPAKVNAPSPIVLTCVELTATFHGKASHAAGSPWDGINALDAAVTGYQAISNLRQQCKPSWRLHGIISKGGSKPNIIPEEAQLYYYLRTPTVGELDTLKEKVSNCMKAAALASGCKVELEWDPKAYLNMITNTDIIQLYEKNGAALGWDKSQNAIPPGTPTGSTDMGNVSHQCPSIHPNYFIGDIPAHSKEFARLAESDSAHCASLLQAKSLAMTALDIMCVPGTLEKIKQTFIQQKQEDAAQ